MSDSDDDRAAAREEEMNKLRCSSASPSAISTASSGSPLVRNSSAGRRPAPTSIAAAQLQCQQQQQQLEFTNRLLGASGPRRQQSAGRQGKAAKLAECAPRKEKPATAAKGQHEEEGARSLGYSLAKSIAFRAYR